MTIIAHIYKILYDLVHTIVMFGIHVNVHIIDSSIDRQSLSVMLTYLIAT